MNKELINYRKERAIESLRDAEILLEKGSLFSAVNRIYYAVFYEVCALLLTQGLSSSKHSGIKALFNKNFVKTGKVKKDLGKFYNHMFEFRQKGDYGDFVEFEKDDIVKWLKQAEKFIGKIEDIIERNTRKK